MGLDAHRKRHLTSLHATMVFTWSGREAEPKAALQVSGQISVLGAIKESVLSGFCGTNFGLKLLPHVVIKL